MLPWAILEFVDDRRKTGSSPLLFPILKPDQDGNYAWYPSQRFNQKFLPEAVAMTERQSLYSLRHSARDALRQIDAPPDVLQALGWSQGRLVSDDYGDKSDPDHLMKYVKRIGYPGLDLSFLYVRES